MREKKSGFATAGLVLGIIGLCTSFIPFINNLSFILALIGILFCIVSLIKRASKGMAIAGAIICILTCIAVVNSQQALSDSLNEAIETFNEDMNAVSDDFSKMSGDKTEEILVNDVDVVLGDFEVIEGEWSTDTKLVVKVTNNNSEKKSFIIQIEAVASDGSRINQDSVYANNLNAGQSQNFEIFNFITSDKIEPMKNATFNIIEVSMY